MKSQVTTIKDLARHLGVSVTTVSKALRGMPDISESTRQLVLKAAKEMDYQPNPIALSLVKNETKTIGVIIPSFTIPFYASAISGIQQKATEHGYQIIVCQSGESYEMEVANTRTLLNSRVDGLIVSLSKETRDFSHFHTIIGRSIPLVLFNRVSNELNVPKVVVDDYNGARLAVQHLLDMGYRRIAHIAGPPNLLLSQQRRQGYLDALAGQGLSVDDTYIRNCDLTIEEGTYLTNYLLSLPEPPDAIFAVCDSVAFGAMAAIKGCGLSIPGDLAIVGFTDEPVATIVDPALTTVSQPTFQIGQLAAELLLEQIHPADGYQPTTHVLPTSLVVRESSGRKGALESLNTRTGV